MILAAAALMAFTANIASAQEAEAPEQAATEEVAEAPAAPAETAAAPEVPLTQALKTKFIQGVLGLALSIERILYLSFSKTNTKKLIADVEKALAEGGIEKAKDVCREARGPVASIYYQGLMHYDQGIDVVEKNIVSYGSVQNSELESGLSWISLFIAIAPSIKNV